MKKKLLINYYRLRSELINWRSSLRPVFRFGLAYYFAQLSMYIVLLLATLPTEKLLTIEKNIVTPSGIVLLLCVLLLSMSAFGFAILSSKLVKSF